MEEIKNNIIYDAYYLISKFGNKTVTNMKIQKLMYFFEAYYMNVFDEDKLYDCHFHAWTYGPVSVPLYKEFKRFGNNPIELSKEEIIKGQEIDEKKKELLDNIYETFKDVDALTLVAYTHMKNSPWYEVWEKNGESISYGEDAYIDKKETRKWFRDVFQRKTE